MTKLLIFTPEISPRIKYIFNFVFGDLLQLNFKVTDEKDAFLRFEGPVINYSPFPLSKGVWIQQRSFLTESGVRPVELLPGKWKDFPVLFYTGSAPDLPFDLFSASFYLISRFEEYLHFEPDIMGRFPAKESVAYKQGFLEIPVVDIWVSKLGQILKIRYPDLVIGKPEFTFMSSLDVDQAWAYLNKGMLRNLGGGLKFMLRTDLKDLQKRLGTLLKTRKDPFDTFTYLKEIHSEYDFRPVLFFQVGKYGRFDKNLPGKHPAMRKLINKVDAFAEIGIHPSFRSDQFNELEWELDVYKSIKGGLPEKSRQHYIRMRFPKTYRNLLKLGVREDYSMGYPEMPGFRAGTATPHNFYDLGEEIETKLKIFPFILMDTCLNEKMQLQPDQALSLIKEFINKVKKVGGTFIPLWHNSSLGEEGEWKGWRYVFEGMLAECTEIV